MWLDVVIVTLGFAGLIWGADKFVTGASAVALNFGVAPLLVGLTIVAFGTSAPEFFSSAVAASQGEPMLAVGNAIGSNIFNIGVALGVAAIVRPILPPVTLLRQELPALLLVTVVTGVLFFDRYLGLLDSLVLVALIIILGVKLYRREARRIASEKVAEAQATTETELKLDTPKITTWAACFSLFFGLVLLVAGAEALVSGASSIAAYMGVSSAIIGLTMVALGTSLPELAASVTSVLRGHHDMAIGNIVGSNMLNLLVVLPFPGLLAAGAIDNELFSRDYATMLLMTCALAAICFLTIKSGKPIGRIYGLTFLAMYGCWFFTIYQQI